MSSIWTTVFNLIKTLTGDVDVKNKGTLQDQINDCFTSASEGKAKVASAITGKGVSTESDATYDTMAANISSIKTSPNLQSKSATLKTSAQTIIPDSGYDGLSDVTVPAVVGTAAVGNVLTGKTFNSATAGIAKTGTMSDYSGTTVETEGTSADDDYTYLDIPESGYYDENSKIRILTDSLNGRTVTKYSIGTSSASSSQAQFDLTLIPNYEKLVLNQNLFVTPTVFQYIARVTNNFSYSYSNGILTMTSLESNFAKNYTYRCEVYVIS